jgi:phage shock protein PspC (stress-responsive transcriptional regulator)
MKRLVRPLKGRVVGGVCAGLAQYFGINATLMRIIWIFLLLPGGLPGLLPYLLLWLIIPSEE